MFDFYTMYKVTLFSIGHFIIQMSLGLDCNLDVKLCRELTGFKETCESL